ncbi:hemicentin-2-like isoform X2 [Dysidea avara]
MWRRNGADTGNGVVLLDDKHRLRIDDAQLSDAGVYNVSITIVISASQGLFIKRYTVITLRVIVPLEVVTQPMNTAVDEWSMRSLECRVSGVPIPSITWTRTTPGDNRGVVSSNITGNEVVVSRLIFDSVRVSDIGEYQCVATNEYYNVTSQLVTVSVTPRLLLAQVIGPDVISVDTLLTVQEAQTVVLSCQSSNMPRWYNDSGDGVSSISSDPVHQMPVNSSTQLLRIAAYTDLYSGRYTCRSTVNSVQLAQSIVLTTDNPSVFSNTTTLFPPVGTSVTLLVHVSGNPVPLPSDIQWYRNDVLIDDMDSSLTLSIDRTMLTISNIMGDYYGIYQCKVTTSAGTRYHNITITQPRAAQANINPAQLNVLVGETAYITCMATGTPPLMISWRYNDSPSLPNDAEVNGDVLVIDSVQLTHSGNYSCVVSNDLSTAEDNVELTVVDPPTVSIRIDSTLVSPQSRPINLTANTEAPQLMCVVTGNPPPLVQWLYNDDALPDGVHTSGSVLTWSRSLSYTDTGLYRCIATNNGGTVNITVELSVNAAAEVRTIRPHLPTIGDTSSSDTFITTLGQTGAIISCVAVGSPRPDVNWVSYNGAALPGHVRSMTSSSGSHDPNQVVVELMWTSGFTSSDTGVYRCEARNSAGNNSVDVTLSIATDTPPTTPPTATPPVDGNELFVQLRILQLDCSQWKVSQELEDFTLNQIHRTIFSSLELECNCVLPDGVLVSHDLSCSEVISLSTLYRGTLLTNDNYTASEVYSILSNWTRTVPSIVVNNGQHKVDTSCELLIESVNDEECGVEGPLLPDDGGSDENNNTLLFGVIGVAVVLLVCVILVLVVVCAWMRCRHSDHNLTRRFSLKMSMARIRGGSGVYVSNSFQGHLNSLGQSSITGANIHATNPGFVANSVANSIAEELSIDTPVEQQNGSAQVENQYDLPNNPRRFVQVQRSPRLSSESRVTTDSGIQSRAHSCDRLVAGVGDVVSPPLQSPHRPLGHSRSAEIDLSQSREGSMVFVEPQVPMKKRQPSFDEMHYLSNVEYFDDNRNSNPPPYYAGDHCSHSQPLETLEYINPQPTPPVRHNYVFTDQDTCSQPFGLSQSFPSASLFPQSKTQPEPYVEPVSLRSSLHSILAQNSQLDTMV